MTAPAIIQDLVNRFRDSRELYRSGRYNEAQLRLEFLNPFFEALGWDMVNRSNFAPQYREVIHEDSLEVEGSAKAPDYAFRIGTTRKFFVEAKKPAVDIRYAIHPAYQLRRYAWNAHLPLSILTDFEELAVYDCRTRPDPKDSAATGRVMLFTFEEYVDRWDELAQIFARDAVWNGSFDRYAEGSKGKRGTTEVDAEFLKEIEEWRILLARNIALRNFRTATKDSSQTDPPPNPPPFAKRGLEGVKDSHPDAGVTNSPHSSSYAAGQPPSMEHVERSRSVSKAGSMPSPGGGSESGANGGEGLTSLSSSREGDEVAKSPELAERSGYVNQSKQSPTLTPADHTPSREGDKGGGSVDERASEPHEVAKSPELAEGNGFQTVKASEAKQPPSLHRAERQLNYAVQTTIDRILFLRICEDRQIEPTDQLLQIAGGSDIYAHLLVLFQKADQKYNSGLFHFGKEKGQTSEPDTFTPTLVIDDKVLRQIIKSTYFPCPYIFNEIPVEILGQVYEQFLGKVIRLTPGGQAKVEEKPEVRKAGGVYYTPRYIVDYIVQNTLGRLLGDSTGVRTDSIHQETSSSHSTATNNPPPSSPSLRPKEGLEGVGGSRSLLGETGTNINGQQSGFVSFPPSNEGDGGTNPSFTPSREGEEGGGALGENAPEPHGTARITPSEEKEQVANPSSTPTWEPDQVAKPPEFAQGSGSYNLSKDGLMESIRPNPVLSADAGTNPTLTPTQALNSADHTPSREGGEGGGTVNLFQNEQMDTIRSTPALVEDAGTNQKLTPTQALNLRVVDPACGSGSFLLGAYQYLLDWHLNYYLTHDPQSHTRGKNPPLVATEGGEYRLTTETKKRILTASIYGVDIDSQAVEVTKLSLLLKLLEGETGQLSLGFERVLPDLGNNIRCGNSLIGWDYFKGQIFPDEEEIQRVNPFDWQRAFPVIFAEGGFDAVIGNPPYIRQESLGDDKPYYQSIYEVYTGTADIYSYFIEKGVKLLAPGGQFSYIVANKWLRAKYGFKLRQWLKARCIEEITDFGDLPVFTGATTYPLILRVSDNPPHNRPRLTTVGTLDFASLQAYVDEHGEIADQTCFDEDGWSLAGKATQDLLAKIRQNSISLGEYVNGKVFYGIKTGLNKAFVIDQATKERLIAEDPRSAELIKPFAQGRDIKRYAPIPVKQYLILIPKGWTNQHRKGNAWNWFSSQYPVIASHLKQFEKEAIARGDKGDYWWELRACDYYDEFAKPKIVFPDISLKGNFTLDLNGVYYGNTAYIMPVNDLFLLGLLNSDLFDFYYRQISSSYRGGYLRYIFQYVTQLPVLMADVTNQDQLELFQRITDLVGRLLTLNHQRPTFSHEAQQQENVMRETEKQINLHIFKLYGLGTEEVRVVSGE